jgi:hypothetical protein
VSKQKRRKGKKKKKKKKKLELAKGTYVGWVHGNLVLRSISNQSLSVCESDIRRSGSVSLVVGNDFNSVVLPDSDTRIGRSEVNSCEKKKGSTYRSQEKRQKKEEERTKDVPIAEAVIVWFSFGRGVYCWCWCVVKTGLVRGKFSALLDLG